MMETTHPPESTTFPPLRGPGYTVSSLRAYADRVASTWEIAHRPEHQGHFGQRIDSARESLEQLVSEFEDHPAPDDPEQRQSLPLLELRQNPRLLSSVLNEISSLRKPLGRMPRVIRPREGDEPRVVSVADAYLQATGAVWDPVAIRIFLERVQGYDSLTLEELWVIPPVLKFLLFEEIVTQACGSLKYPETRTQEQAEMLRLRMRSLMEVGNAAWTQMVEPLIFFEPILRQDPTETYAAMDFQSREMYRKRVAAIAKRSDCSESQVAEVALALAREASARKRAEDPRRHLRHSHIGYYLIDRGFPLLASRTGYRPEGIDRIRHIFRNNADDVFIGGILSLTAILIGLILMPLAPNYSILGGLAWAFLLLLLPAMQWAVDLVNHTITAVFKPSGLPKLDFSNGVPKAYTTLVVVPTLLGNPGQVRELFNELEVRYLANEDPNIHFGLLTDLPDSVTRPRPNDVNPLVDLAVDLTDQLNQRYKGNGAGSFFLLHRHRIFNPRQGVWMGWERKRGKLLDLNKFLKGQFDAFPIKAGNVKALSEARYVITLDSDTQLPRGAALALIGALAHPLNRAIIDPELRIVTEGYGILQPRIGVSVQSAARSRLASIYSGQTGFDIYTRAVSDVYQDLYGEGIFTGKGIYEIETLHAVLDRRFPRNALLSHDLIEGSYARVGLATDIELIDDYPSHLSAYNRRKHRWVRGDWQIAQWLFSRVPNEEGRYLPNPILTISRWKIFDNLRRSLVDPFTFFLLIAGWLGLPGGALYWTLITLFLIFVPTFVQLAFNLGRAGSSETPGALRDAWTGFGQGLFIAVLNLAFLPHQTLLALDAIVRSLVRSFITGRRLLEWETAAEAESHSHRRTPVDRYLYLTPLAAIVVGVVIFFGDPKSFFAALPILVLWCFPAAITQWLNHPPREIHPNLKAEEITFLRELGLRTWRFFHEFGGESHNFLIPDNVEETGAEAARVSPTNLGLLLNARQAAWAFGYLTLPEFAELTSKSLASYSKLERFHGHPCNWYDTRTLQPLPGRTISSVDSGNLAASFYTLRAGIETTLESPLADQRLIAGVRDHANLLASLHEDANEPLVKLPVASAGIREWIAWAMEQEHAWPISEPIAAEPIAEGSAPDTKPDTAEDQSRKNERLWWQAETRQRIEALACLARDYMPWLLPEFAPLMGLSQLHGIASAASLVTAGEATDLAADLHARLARAAATFPPDSPLVVLAAKLSTTIGPAQQRIEALTRSLRDSAAQAMRFAAEMDFTYLFNRSRMLLSIGYDVERGSLHEACYDLLASEARIAAFLAIAKGDIPQQSWFHLGRTHTVAYGHPVLISWTGTMFEYLMPSLWMRSYPDTLVSRTLANVIEVQRAFARELGIPWGISESGWGKQDELGHYQYQAFGVPAIALKWDASAGPVISPYSTCLALGLAPHEALHNLKKMAGQGWIGAYGFYEAADYQESRKHPALVREWMAHHQGMSLAAILNLLEDNLIQEWFHSNADLQATQLLLQEKPIKEFMLRAERRATRSRNHHSPRKNRSRHKV